MKFLKISIVVLFILSLSSAATSLYLSNIRENEKEKRIYLEDVKAELEGQVEELETENAQLSEKVSQLEAEKKQLEDQLQQEKNARQETLSLISQKDADLESIRGEAQQAQFAFKDAQKRNEELERILDELETRMRQIEGQNQLPGSEVGYLEINPVAPAVFTPPANELVMGDLASAPVEEKKEQPVEAKKEETPEVEFKPLTNLPEPPRKRKIFSFLRSSDKKEEQLAVTEPTSAPSSEAVIPPAEQAPQEPVQVKTETVKEPIQKTDQSIAAGSVLLVNRKYNFVVVNLGSRQSLNLNDVVSIQQEGNEIAKARVEKVYDDYSAAYIIEEQSERPIAEGDAVTRA